MWSAVGSAGTKVSTLRTFCAGAMPAGLSGAEFAPWSEAMIAKLSGDHVRCAGVRPAKVPVDLVFLALPLQMPEFAVVASPILRWSR